MDKYQKIIMEYAQNRADLAEINKRIQNLFDDGEGNYIHIDVYQFRAFFYEDADQYGCPQWEGWQHCLEQYDYDEKQMMLAKLLDEKKKINKEVGQIKRRICTIGRGLIRSLNTL